MKATYNIKPTTEYGIEGYHNDGKIAQNRKENHFAKEVAILDKKTGRAIVTARIYHTNAMAYACLWTHSEPKNKLATYCNGGGKAAGYGYHKASAALGDAINNAGFKLSERIDGCGDAAMESALVAIAKLISGKRSFFIHQANA